MGSSPKVAKHREARIRAIELGIEMSSSLLIKAIDFMDRETSKSVREYNDRLAVKLTKYTENMVHELDECYNIY